MSGTRGGQWKAFHSIQQIFTEPYQAGREAVLSLPSVDHVACQKAEHIKTRYSSSSSLWPAPPNNRQPISDGRMTLALIKLHFVPATPSPVGSTAKNPSGGLASRWHLASLQAAGSGCSACLGNPGKLPSPFMGGSAGGPFTMQPLTEKTHPTHQPQLLVRSAISSGLSGREGAVTGQLSETLGPSHTS